LRPINNYTSFDQLAADPVLPQFENFVNTHPEGNYFQGPSFFRLIDGLLEFSPLLLFVRNEGGEIQGSLLGYFQVFGSGLKSWMSRRLVVIGGPLVDHFTEETRAAITEYLLENLEEQARGKAIYVEFRNLYDTAGIRSAFENRGFEYKPHLNFLLKTDNEEAVIKRMSRSRRREIRVTLEAGATIAEPESEGDVMTLYGLLEKLYIEKIKKPLISVSFFLKFWKTGAGKIFLVKYQGEIKGGIVCPIFNNNIIYEWYVCGVDGEVKNVYPSALATWAPIEYGLKNGLEYFDFLGAGKPDEEYGVREFKSRFGGEEVCFGRYEFIVNKPLYQMGKLALSLYQKLPI
jgi:peptidoglycan biosynthesis/recognition FemAB-like protein